MKYRHPLMIIVLPIVTFGIYPWVWLVKTKNEMNKHYGVYIQPAWYLFIPFVNLYWLWSYAKGVETVTQGKRSAVEVLGFIILLNIFGMAIIQAEFNKVYIPQRRVES
jgi:hypothetical protein